MRLRWIIVRRLLLTIPTLLCAVTVIFVALSTFTPNQRVAYIAGSNTLSRDAIKAMIREYGLDQPIFVQYVNWLRDVVTFNFGRSMLTGERAIDRVFTCLPATLELMLYSVPLILLFGIRLGTQSAIHSDKFQDHASRLIGTLGASIPVFALIAFLYGVSIWNFRFDPSSRLSYLVGIDYNVRLAAGDFTEYTRMITIDALLNGDVSLFLDAARHLVLPVAVLVFAQSAAVIRITRSSLIEAANKGYFQFALTKGFSRKQAVNKHAKKNSLGPILTVTGLLIGGMLTNLMIVETAFYIQGFGWLCGWAARMMDVPVVFACTILVLFAFILINTIVDILYQIADPRVQLS